MHFLKQDYSDDSARKYFEPAVRISSIRLTTLLHCLPNFIKMKDEILSFWFFKDQSKKILHYYKY